MNPSEADPAARRAEIAALRPELHRYCARLAGSAFDGEDIVQDAIARALAAVDALEPGVPLRPWLFRIAHNRALDHLRSQAVRRSEPIEAAAQVAEDRAHDPDEALARKQAATAAFSRFAELPILQRSVVILKDVLDHSLQDIAGLLDLSIDSVKGALHRGRTRLRQLGAKPEPGPARPPTADAIRFSALFNARDWDALRTLLAEDVHLTQTTLADRRGRREVGIFFTTYATIADFHLKPARLDGSGEEVIAVFGNHADEAPAYLMQVQWRDGRIARIRDFRYAPYILDNARLVFPRP
ncbi:sigma-70 family RNA polymerase sigma factor [Sphingomonas sp.]|uniref:sigma-70 family RNA polymerase sigma factor n=1 Tax=Sphingomonas sp. TaxID=28214 RepID=UPI0031D08283